MLEVIVTFVFTLIIYNLENFWWKLGLLILLLILILPGVYAMLSVAPYVPSNKRQIKALLNLGQFKKSDVVADFGCGDGRVVRAVVQEVKVKKGIGYEISLPTYVLALVQKYFAKSKESIRMQNFWNLETDQFDVIICFLQIDPMKKFEAEIWPKLKKGTRVLSNTFKMKGLKPTATEDGVYLYVKK